MTGAWIKLSAHQRQWMLGNVEECMKVLAEEGCNNCIVVPVPNHVEITNLRSLRSDFTRDAELLEVQVVQAVFPKDPFEVSFAEVGLVHAKRSESDVDNSRDTGQL